MIDLFIVDRVSCDTSTVCDYICRRIPEEFWGELYVRGAGYTKKDIRKMKKTEDELFESIKKKGRYAKATSQGHDSDSIFNLQSVGTYVDESGERKQIYRSIVPFMTQEEYDENPYLGVLMENVELEEAQMEMVQNTYDAVDSALDYRGIQSEMKELIACMWQEEHTNLKMLLLKASRDRTAQKVLANLVKIMTQGQREVLQDFLTSAVGSGSLKEALCGL